MSFLDVLYMTWWWTGEGMNATFDRLGRHLGFDWEHRPSMQQMSAAVVMLLAHRDLAIASTEAFVRQRTEAKRCGQRQPTPAENRHFEERLAVVRNHWALSVGVPTE